MKSKLRTIVGLFLTCLLFQNCSDGLRSGAVQSPNSSSDLEFSRQTINDIGKIRVVGANASGSYPNFPAANAIDNNPRTMWNAGGFAPQFIELDLGGHFRISGLRLTAIQLPAGNATHIISGRSDKSGFVEMGTISGFVKNGDVLQLNPASQPAEGVRFIKIDTTASPSWIAWGELEVFGQEIVPAFDSNTLRSGQALRPGQKMVSTNGLYSLVYQTDGNLVLYRGGTTPLWETATYSTLPGKLVLQGDGNLVLYDYYSRALWASGTNRSGAFVIDDAGQLILYTFAGTVEKLVYGQPPAPEYTLSVTVLNNGGRAMVDGQVATYGGSTISIKVRSGDTKTIQLEPFVGYELERFEGDGGCGAQVQMNMNKNCSVRFRQIPSQRNEICVIATSQASPDYPDFTFSHFVTVPYGDTAACARAVDSIAVQHCAEEANGAFIYTATLETSRFSVSAGTRTCLDGRPN
ncbi:MAG: discoidin domain-containing protein [Bdellovibrionia bacterium]